MMAWFFNRLFGRFRSYEKAVIDSLSANLSKPAQAILRGQLERVNKIQRHADGKEVNLYCMQGGKAFLAETFRFPNGSPELLLATVAVKSPEFTKPLRAEVWMSNGRVFSIIFNRAPNGINGDVDVSEVKICADPMELCTDAAVNLDKRERLLEKINSKLPEEYLELVQNDVGSVINGWRIYGVSEMRKIVQSDCNYYLLAEKENRGAIGVVEENDGGQLYYLDYEDDVPLKIEGSLRSFIENREVTE